MCYAAARFCLQCEWRIVYVRVDKFTFLMNTPLVSLLAKFSSCYCGLG